MKAHVLLVLVLFTAACAGILGIRPRGRHPFEHREHVLKGIHCNSCHEGIATAGETGALHLPKSESCRSCHTKPHDERSCDGCHGLAGSRAGASEAREHLRFEHKTHVPRVKGDCVRCHVDVEQDAVALRPRMATCGSCHAHREQLAVRDCDGCHVNLKDEGTTPDDHLIHDGNFIREHGVRAAAERQLCASCHSEKQCSGCHGITTPGLPARLAFDAPMGNSIHRAGFKSHHAEEARGDPGLCTTCHAPSVCADCHARSGVAAKGGTTSPHPPGWLGLRGQRNEHGRAAWREPDVCASCHGGAGEALCVGCHRVGGPGGNPHAPGFRSTKRPALDRPCRLCHGGAL